MLVDLIDAGLLEFDVEFGNAQGFFSASKAGQATTRYGGHLAYDARVATRTMQIKDHIAHENGKVTRRVAFCTKEAFPLYDLVSRFVVYSNDRPARIADEIIPHTGQNLYHQHETDTGVVPIGNRFCLLFRQLNPVARPGFDSVLYIRDEAVESDKRRRWIVHHRHIVQRDSAQLIVRGCNPRFEGPLPAQNLFPRPLKKALFRIRERRWPHFPIMSVGEITLPKGAQVALSTQIEVHDG